MEIPGQNSVEINTPGSSFGKQWRTARRRFVWNRENRRPGLTGVEKEMHES